MDIGSNKGLFTLLAVVIFGIFLSMSYWLFQDELVNVLADVMDKTSEMTSMKLENNGLILTEEKYFTITSAGKITNYDISGGTKLVIPNVINGIIVTSIGVDAFYNKGITELVLPSTLLKIDDGEYTPTTSQVRHGAFVGNNLQKLVLPEGLTYIGKYAFYGCNINKLTISNTVTYIGFGSFEHNNLTHVNIPNSVKTIVNWAFGDNLLVEITVPESVTTISPYFIVNNKTTLKSINIPIGLSNILVADKIIMTYTTEAPYYDASIVNYY